MRKRCLIRSSLFICGIVLSLFFIGTISASFNIAVSDNGTLAQVFIYNATNVYSYEINFADTQSNSVVTFANVFTGHGTVSQGTDVQAFGGKYILSVYESILTAGDSGINSTGNVSVFNISHTGNLTLRASVQVDGFGVEAAPQVCTETVVYTDWSACSGNLQSRTGSYPICLYDNITEERACSVTVINTGGSSGGGGGGSAGTQALNIEFGSPDIQESGKVSVPVILKNGGTVAFNNIVLTGYLKKNGQVLTDIPVELTKTSIASLTAGKSESFTVTANIKENDVNFYELVIDAKSTTPAYEVSNKVLFTFVGVEGGKVLKVVAFTSGLIDEHPECLELKDMITDAQSEFNKGNTQLALQKANQAVEACKSYLESPLKPIVSQKQYDKIPLYLGIGIASAILLGIVFNVYRSYVFRRKFR